MTSGYSQQPAHRDGAIRPLRRRHRGKLCTWRFRAQEEQVKKEKTQAEERLIQRDGRRVNKGADEKTGRETDRWGEEE